MSQFLGRPLSKQEKQVLEHLSAGESLGATAKLMELSSNTVSTYLTRIKLKLGAKSTTHAAVLYVKGGA